MDDVTRAAENSGGPPTADDDDRITRQLGRRLRARREARGWTRPDLAARLPSRPTEHTLLTYEHGTRRMTVERLIELCDALGEDAGDLLYEITGRPQPDRAARRRAIADTLRDLADEISR